MTHIALHLFSHETEAQCIRQSTTLTWKSTVGGHAVLREQHRVFRAIEYWITSLDILGRRAGWAIRANLQQQLMLPSHVTPVEAVRGSKGHVCYR